MAVHGGLRCRMQPSPLGLQAYYQQVSGHEPSRFGAEPASWNETLRLAPPNEAARTQHRQSGEHPSPSRTPRRQTRGAQPYREQAGRTEREASRREQPGHGHTRSGGTRSGATRDPEPHAIRSHTHSGDTCLPSLHENAWHRLEHSAQSVTLRSAERSARHAVRSARPSRQAAWSRYRPSAPAAS